MSAWQFSQNNTIINSSPTAERDADEIVLFDESGNVIIGASKTKRGWVVSASDHYHQWTEFAGFTASDAESAIHSMFLRIEHEHEVTDTTEYRERDGVFQNKCELCGSWFAPFTNDE